MFEGEFSFWWALCYIVYGIHKIHLLAFYKYVLNE